MITTKGNIDNRSKRRMAPGIHTKCSYLSGEVKETEKGNKFLELWFANPVGETQKKAIFFPTGNPSLREGENTDQAKEREMNAFTGACLDILISFFTIEEAEVSGNTIEDFAKKFLTKMKGATGFCNVIVQYTTDYKWTEFPKYGWIEKFVEGTPPNLQVSDTLRLAKKGVKSVTSQEGERKYF
jgi:hypothetical protein